MAKLGRYDLRYLVATGGMASVSLARLSTAEGFTKWVAIKTIHPHIAQDVRFVRMFLNEAKLAARIDHPNVCSVFDFGEGDGLYYLAMEYLHGESLARVLERTARARRPGLSVPLAARIVADAARGLHAAHELTLDDGRPAGVVHRDISPQNLFVLYGGATKVVDFGIAGSVEHAGENTTTGEIKGKLAYMAPEQIQAKPLDRRTDVWALGVVLWESIAGERLFRRGNDPTTMRAVLEYPVPSPSSAQREVPPEIETIIARALSRDVDKRFPTTLAMARELETWLAQSGSLVGPDELAAEMTELFRDDIAKRNELLHRPFPDDSAPASVALSAAAAALASRVESATVVDRAGKRGALPAEENSVQLSFVDEDRGTLVRRNAIRRASLPMPLVTHAARPTKRLTTRSTLGFAAALVVLLGAGGGGLVFSGAQTQDPDVRRTTPPTDRARPATIDGVGPAHQTATVSVPTSAPSTPTRTVVASAAAVTPVVAPAIAPRSTVPANLAAPASRTTPAITASTRSRTRALPRGDGDSDPADPTSAAATANGSLTLFSPLPCQVFEGSRLLGHTPIVERPMPPGEHTLRVVPDNGEPAQNFHVSIAPGAVVSVRWE